MEAVIYKRELNHSYLVRKCNAYDISDSYAYRTMAQNRIGKLLFCKLRNLDGETFLYYDISSRQSMERLYEGRRLDMEDLRRIIYAVAAMQEDLGEYLLDEQGLILEPSMMFADVETEELYFCFDPEGRQQEHRYENLADFFLGHVEHGEEHAVNIAYRFYQMSKAEYFVLSSFLPFLEKELTEWRGAKHRGMPEWEKEIPKEQEPIQPVSAQILTPLPESIPEELPKGGKIKSLLERILGFGKRKNGKKGRRQKAGYKKAAEEAGDKEEWPDSVWNSYAEQASLIQTGETVYFTDLEKRVTPSGIPCLTEEGGERRFYLNNLPMTVGKLKGKVSVVLTDGSVSRMHARLVCVQEGVCVEDLNSRNGTLVNGRKLEPNETVTLTQGDLVQFGRERFRYGFVDSNAIK